MPQILDSSIVIDTDRAVELLRQTVNQYGADHTNLVVCRYWDDKRDQPSCIVGCALALAGLAREHIIALDSASRTGNSLTAENLPDVLPGVTEAAARILNRAQMRTDGPASWGDALAAAVA